MQDDLAKRIAGLSPEKLALLMQQLNKDKKADPLAKIQPQPRDAGTLPLSFAQQRLWFLDQFEPGNPAYNLLSAVRLRGVLDVDALKRSIAGIVARHEAVRTTFAQTADEQPTQVIAPALDLPLTLIDVEQLPPAEREAEVQRLATIEAQQSFDLQRGPLLRTTLIRLHHREHVLLLTLHHIISDGWSSGIFIREVSAFYTAFISGQQPALPPLPVQYADFAQWQRQWLSGPVLEQQLGYWQRQLGGNLPVLELPTDRPRPAVQMYRGARHSFTIDAGLTKALRTLAQQEKTTLFAVLLSGFKTLLHRYTGQRDLLVGTPVANRNRAEIESLIGFFVNTLVLRTDLSGDPSFRELLRRVHTVAVDAQAHQDLPFDKLIESFQLERDLSRPALFQVLFTLQNTPMPALQLPGLQMEPLLVHTGSAKFDIELNLEEQPDALIGLFEYNTDLFDAATIARMSEHLLSLLRAAIAQPDQRISHLPLLSPDEARQLLLDWNSTATPIEAERGVHQLIEAQAARTPDAVALICGDESLSYRELNRRGNQLARQLQARGVGPETRVGVCVERSIEMIVGLLGVLKAGAAYVPIDPSYPAERVQFMLHDAEMPLLLTQQRLQQRLQPVSAQMICLDADWPTIARHASENLPGAAAGETIAYVIYTSGSTGQPKGVQIPHRAVVNFFAGMDQRIGAEPPGVWLALTSISFDISVLELFWTLARGFTVVVQQDDAPRPAGGVDPAIAQRPLDFSLFYFASESGDGQRDPYHLLLDGARFADQHGFAAVWTPERHFHAFGGPYPNPSVTSAAVAAITKRIQIRAGSVVLPLHHPLRVAEEWAVVDNLSQGRVGISFASGWHADDFVFAPEQYATRKDAMLDGIQTVQRLWRGERITGRNGAGHTINVGVLPRPKQAELPVWLTASSNPETFAIAARNGWNLLTHLLGQSIPELAEKIALYRRTWREAGHPGDGHISLMLHAFVGEDQQTVRETVREPFKNYLRSSIGLVQNLARSMGQNAETLSQDDLDALLDHAFERYFETSGLFGTVERCQTIVNQLKAIGVDELACLVDFGIDEELVLHSLPLLDRLRQQSNTPQVEAAALPVPEQILRHGVTHLQCTPSRAAMLLLEPNAANSLQQLRTILLGGEALPSTLAAQLREITAAELHNMYGPTETTIWSSSERISGGEITIGRPIANTQIYLLDEQLQPVPLGVPGRLYIGGDGLARGYLRRPDLTAERFIPDPFSQTPGSRLYHTGDLARYLPEGRLLYLGRSDQQIKLRGYRIELGEIETALRQDPQIRQAVVVVREDDPGDARLVAYVVREQGNTGTGEPTEDLALDLRSFLLDRLPEYMIPSAFVPLDELPLTPNGKIDRRALPRPDTQQPTSEERYVAPRSALESVIANTWAKILGVERIGVHDNFFLLGGHSLLAIKIAAQLGKTFQMQLPVRRLFEQPTVAALAQVIVAQESRPGQSEKIAQLIQRIKADSPDNLRKTLEQKRKERENV
jgi:natural product biosynthesis luciferase-like monooxygenase protein